MHWVSFTQRKPGGGEKWVELNMALAFKIQADTQGGGSFIHFGIPQGEGHWYEIVVEPPNRVAELVKEAAGKAP